MSLLTWPHRPRPAVAATREAQLRDELADARLHNTRLTVRLARAQQNAAAAEQALDVFRNEIREAHAALLAELTAARAENALLRLQREGAGKSKARAIG